MFYEKSFFRLWTDKRQGPLVTDGGSSSRMISRGFLQRGEDIGSWRHSVRFSRHRQHMETIARSLRKTNKLTNKLIAIVS